VSARLSGFEWDDGNLEHCRKHGVSQPEIEDVFSGAVIILPDPGHSQVERRLRAIGRTGDGRAVFIVFTIRERDGGRFIRPVSARYMHQEEIKRYEKDNPDV
jgi:uncharacterized DUF497 family protein